MVKNPPTNAGDRRDLSLIPGSGRSPGERNDDPLQCYCLENSMDREVWQATVHRVAQNRTRLKRLSTHACDRSETQEIGSGNVMRSSAVPERRKEGEERRKDDEEEGKKRKILVLLEPAYLRNEVVAPPVGEVRQHPLTRVPLSPNLPARGLLSGLPWQCFLNQGTVGDQVLSSVCDFSSCTLLFSSFYFFG